MVFTSSPPDSFGPTKRKPNRRIRPPAPPAKSADGIIKITGGQKRAIEYGAACCFDDADGVADKGRKSLIAGAGAKKDPVIADRFGPRLMQQLDQSPADKRIAP